MAASAVPFLMIEAVRGVSKCKMDNAILTNSLTVYNLSALVLIEGTYSLHRGIVFSHVTTALSVVAVLLGYYKQG